MNPLDFHSFSEVTQSFLDQIRSFRYEKSVAPEDEGKNKSLGANVPSRDLFGYGQLVKETISKCLDSTVANADVFRDLATKQMQSSNPQTRGSASALAKHPFFDQPLLHAQEFLTEIAIKSHAEKEEFFRYDICNLLSTHFLSSNSRVFFSEICHQYYTRRPKVLLGLKWPILYLADWWC